MSSALPNLIKYNMKISALSTTTMQLLGVLCCASAFTPLGAPSRNLASLSICHTNLRYQSFNQKSSSSLPMSPKEAEEEKELTPETVAEMIEVSFVNACLQLAQGFVDVLKLMIVSIKSGYELGVQPTKLIDMVDAIPIQSAGRELMAEEIILRNTWIQVVYLTLSSLGHSSKGDSSFDIDSEVSSQYEPFVATLKEQREAGNQLEIESILKQFSGLDGDPMKTAIASQSLRAMWLTLTVLEEEERCNTDFARQDAPMKPPIPGAFDETS